MNAARVSELVAVDALGAGTPLHVALREPSLPAHPQRLNAARAAEAGRLGEALSLLGLDPLVRDAALADPGSAPDALRALRALPTTHGFNAAFAVSASYLVMVLLLEALVAIVSQAKVVPVLNKMLEDAGARAAMPAPLAFLHDLSSWVLDGGAGWLGAIAMGLLAVAVLLAVQRPSKTVRFRGDLRDLHDARVAAVAAALERRHVPSDRIAGLVSTHGPSLARQLGQVHPDGLGAIQGWSELSAWLLQRALERNARWVRRVRLVGGALVLFVALMIAASVYTVLPALGALS